MTMAWVRRHCFEITALLPLCVYLALLTVAPIVDTLRLSLTAADGATFPSLANYRVLVASELFHTTVLNTAFVALLSIVLELGVGLAIALTLHTHFPLRGLVRSIMLVPLGVPTIVSGAVMLLVFSRSGYLNSALWQLADLVNRVPGVEWSFVPLSWTVAGGWRTLATVAVADMWKVMPIVTLVLLAGLQAIPDALYEAADVDGATRWQRFRRITLPLLLPYMTMAIILRAIDAFRIFELALVLAGRVEPVLGTFIWNRYAPPTSDVTGAAAASVVLFVLIMVFIILYLRLVAVRREVEL
jgi:trehalose transport system permease protein